MGWGAQRSRSWANGRISHVWPCGAWLWILLGRLQVCSEQDMEFMEEIMERSGLGVKMMSGLSKGILAMAEGCARGPQVFSEQNMEFMEKIIER